MEFEQAVDEAKTCMEFRMDKTTTTPRELFAQVAKLRPKEYTKVSVGAGTSIVYLISRRKSWCK